MRKTAKNESLIRLLAIAFVAIIYAYIFSKIVFL